MLFPRLFSGRSPLKSHANHPIQSKISKYTHCRETGLAKKPIKMGPSHLGKKSSFKCATFSGTKFLELGP